MPGELSTLFLPWSMVRLAQPTIIDLDPAVHLHAFAIGGRSISRTDGLSDIQSVYLKKATTDSGALSLLSHASPLPIVRIRLLPIHQAAHGAARLIYARFQLEILHLCPFSRTCNKRTALSALRISSFLCFASAYSDQRTSLLIPLRHYYFQLLTRCSVHLHSSPLSLGSSQLLLSAQSHIPPRYSVTSVSVTLNFVYRCCILILRVLSQAYPSGTTVPTPAAAATPIRPSNTSLPSEMSMPHLTAPVARPSISPPWILALPSSLWSLTVRAQLGGERNFAGPVSSGTDHVTLSPPISSCFITYRNR